VRKSQRSHQPEGSMEREPRLKIDIVSDIV